MEKIRTWIKAKITWTKNNIQLIILIPTILGGLWQVMELSNMSVSFIRFFSVSQLVADGLLILFVLGILALIFQVTKLGITPKFNEELVKTEKKRELISRVLLNIAVLSLFAWFSYMAFYDFFAYQKIELASIGFGIVAVFLFVKTLNYLIQLFRFILKSRSRAKKKKQKKLSWLLETGLNLVLPFVLTGVFYLFLKTTFTIVVSFRKNYLLPNELRNVEFLECYFENTHNLSSKEWEIVYFNDSYIFTELKETDRQYLIIDFQTLLESKHCTERVILTPTKENVKGMVKDSVADTNIGIDSLAFSELDTFVSKNYEFQY